MTTERKTAITKASQRRIARFVDGFIRSSLVRSLEAERDSDFFNEPERASRVAEEAEFGGDGKTHAEVIGDWRDAFGIFLRDRRGNDIDRFAAGVEAHFDAVEAWHEAHGSLFRQIL